MIRRLLAAVLVLFVGVCGPATVHADERLPLHRGDTGQHVLEVQYVLRAHGYTLAVDGRYGPQTEHAVEHWQHASRLAEDGVVGPVTYASLIASVSKPAVRLHPPPAVEPVEAPAGLDNCAEMSWYRQQAGLPDVFDQLGWRESNCRNEDSVHTFCCYGYLQLYIASHLRSPGYRAGVLACGVTSADDINSDTPDDKRRQMCVAKVLYDVSGLRPWAL